MKKFVDWTLMLLIASLYSLGLDNYRGYLADEEKAEEVLNSWVLEGSVDASPVVDDLAYLMQEDFSELMGKRVFLPGPVIVDCGIRITVVEGDEVKDYRYYGDYTQFELEVAEIIALHLGIERMDRLKPKGKKFKKFVSLFEEFQEADDEEKSELLCNIGSELEREYGPPSNGTYAYGWSPIGESGVLSISVDWDDEYGLSWLVFLLAHEYGHTLIRHNASKEYRKEHAKARKDGFNQEIITINETAANEIEYRYFLYFYQNHDVLLDDQGYIKQDHLKDDIAATVGCSFDDAFSSDLFQENPAKDVIRMRYSGNYSVSSRITFLYDRMGMRDFVFLVGNLYSFEDLYLAEEIARDGGSLEDIIEALEKG